MIDSEQKLGGVGQEGPINSQVAARRGDDNNIVVVVVVVSVEHNNERNKVIC